MSETFVHLRPRPPLLRGIELEFECPEGSLGGPYHFDAQSGVCHGVRDNEPARGTGPQAAEELFRSRCDVAQPGAELTRLCVGGHLRDGG